MSTRSPLLSPERRARLKPYALAALGCAALVLALDLLTNTLDTARYYWDFALYYDMAERGLIGNDNLIAPFVYRFLTPLLAGGIARILPIEHTLAVSVSPAGDLFYTSTYPGFVVIAYAAAIAQLVSVWALARYFGARGWRATVPVLAIALSLYNVRFLLFDVARPDHLAYPLMVVAMLAVFERRIVLALVVSCVGLFVREFLAIPLALLIAALLWDFWRTRDRSRLAWAGVVMLVTAACILVPRLVIPISVSGQYLDPFNQSSADLLETLVRTPLSRRRWFNLLFNVASYTLPLWLLLTPARLRSLWRGLAGYRAALALYVALVLALAMYGGTDLWRFTTFLFVPLVIALAIVLPENVSWVEVAYMLGAVAYYNKLHLEIPNEIGAYLDFYGGYDIRINEATLARVIQLIALGAGAVALRGLLMLARRRSAGAAASADARS